MDREAIARLAVLLEQESISSGREAQSLARWLWEDILGKKPGDPENRSRDEQAKLHDAIARLKKGEPVQYIAGHAWFYGMKFNLTPDVLIPRPETEELVEWVLANTKRTGKKELQVLDIGTGSGCIAIVLKKMLNSHVHIMAIDISEEALIIAEANAAQHGVDILFRQVDFLKNGFSGLGPFDVIVSNPPYISREIAGAGIVARLKYEPETALYPPGDDPDIFYKKIIDEGTASLLRNGACYLELNEFRAEEVRQYAVMHGWQAEVRIDMQGFPRMMKMWGGS